MSLFYHDAKGKIAVPDIYLKKRNGKTIGLLPATGLTVTENLNDTNTVSFEVPRRSNGVDHPCYDALEPFQLVYLPPHGHFSIQVETISDGTEVKRVEGISWENELDSRYLDSFQVNTFEEGDETDGNGNYIRSHLFDESDKEHSILHRALDGTGWTISMAGSSEEYAKLCGRYPTYDITRQSVRSFLNELQEEYDLLFIYGKEQRTITCWLLSDYGRDTGIYASFENLNQKIEIEADEDAVVTALRVSGGDGIYTEDVIPAPSGQLICLDYFLNCRYMSEETIAAWQSYTAHYEMASDLYGDKLLLWEKKNILLNEYLHAVPKTPIKEEDGTLQELNRMSREELDAAFTWIFYEDSAPAEERYNYGQAYLQAIYDAYGNAKAARIEAKADGGQTNPTGDAAYDQILLVLDAVQDALRKRNTQIELLTVEINAINQEKNALRQGCDIKTRFREYFRSAGLSGEDLDASVSRAYAEFQSFLREDEYSNDNYFATDLDSYQDRMEITRELIAQAEKKLKKSSRPHVRWNCTISNPALRKELDFARSTLDIGNFMTLEMHEGYAEKIRIISAEIPYEKPEELRLTFADRLESDSAAEDIGKEIGTATSAAASLNALSRQKDNYDSAYHFVQDIINHGLNAALTGIYNNDHQEITIDRYGLWGRSKKTAGDFDDEQVLIQKNQILFTDDNWKTVRSALGKIKLKSEEGTEVEKYGLIADTIAVKDLYSLDARIGGWVIEKNALSTDNFEIAETDGHKKVISGTYLGSDGSILTPNLNLVPKSGLTIDVNSFHVSTSGNLDSGTTLDAYLETVKNAAIHDASIQMEDRLSQIITYGMESSASSVLRYPDGCRPGQVTFTASQLVKGYSSPYEGIFVIRGYDGAAWTTMFHSVLPKAESEGPGEPGPVPEEIILLSEKEWNVFELNGNPILGILCELYAPEDIKTENLLAYQLVSVVNDASLATDGIFRPICSYTGCQGTVECEKSEDANAIFTIYGATADRSSIGDAGKPIQIDAYDSPESQVPAASYSLILPSPLRSAIIDGQTVRDILMKKDGRWGILQLAGNSSSQPTPDSFYPLPMEEQSRWNRIRSYPGYTRYQVSYPQGPEALQPLFDCELYSEISYQNTVIQDMADQTKYQLDGNVTETERLTKVLQENVLIAGRAGDLQQALALKQAELEAGRIDLSDPKVAEYGLDPYPFSYPYLPEAQTIAVTYLFCYQDSLEQLTKEDGLFSLLTKELQDLLTLYQQDPSNDALPAKFIDIQSLYDTFLIVLKCHQEVAKHLSFHVQDTESKILGQKIEKINSGMEMEQNHIEFYLNGGENCTTALTLAPGVMIFSKNRIWSDPKELGDKELAQLLSQNDVSAYCTDNGLASHRLQLEDSLQFGEFQLQRRIASDNTSHLTLFSAVATS